jgi:hypothetical protein
MALVAPITKDSATTRATMIWGTLFNDIDLSPIAT